MSVELSRRRLLAGLGSTVLLSTFGNLPALGVDLGSIFGTIGGAFGVGLFPGAAAALGGFELVKLLFNANDLVENTKQLESHIDTVLDQVSDTLQTVKTFVEDCDKALTNIENLVKQLPDLLSKEFNAIAVKEALGRLQGHTGLMAQYLQSRSSIHDNADTIRKLNDDLVKDINSLEVLQSNPLQFTLHAVPSVTTWMQGYTAYNLTLKPENRLQNPWEHEMIKTIAVPHFQSLLKSIQQQQQKNADIDFQLPLDSGVIYTFDGNSFSKTEKAFAERYPPGGIDGGYYYTIYPDSVAHPPGAPFYSLGNPQPGDFCLLGTPTSTVRLWMTAPLPNTVFGTGSPEVIAGETAFVTYNRLIKSQMKSVIAFNQVSQGWQVFQDEVQSKLVVGDRDQWTKMRVLPKPKRSSGF
jgi:hypothetical protein